MKGRISFSARVHKKFFIYNQNTARVSDIEKAEFKIVYA